MASWLGEPLVRQHRGLDLGQLPLNYAYVLANTTLRNAGVYTVGDDCYHCPFKLLQPLHHGKDVSWQLDTSVQLTWRVMKNNQQQYLARNYRRGLVCEMRPGLGERAVYRLEVGRCGLDAEVPPVDRYQPLMLCGLVFLAILLIYMSAKSLLSCRRKVLDMRNGKPLQEKDEKDQKQHMKSLHILRGFLLSLLLFLTNGGGGYPLFNNTRGELTLADWSFFIYIWTVGFRIPTKLSEEKCKGLSKRNIFVGIVKRTLIVVFVGLVIDSIPFITGSASESQMIWWPLQKLGAAYFTAASLYLLTVSHFEFKSQKLIPKIISNAVTLKWCLLVGGLIFAIIAMFITTALSINCQGNADLHENLAEFPDRITEVTPSCNSTAAEMFNQVLMGRSQGIFSINGYYGFSAGLMGILTAVALTILGLTAGTVYLKEDSHKIRLQIWMFWGTVFAIFGLTLAGLSFPLQLNLWPIAFIFIVSSLATYLQSLIYILTEKAHSGSSIFTAAGVTSLALLTSHFLLSSSLPINWRRKFSNHLYYLVHNIGFVLLWIIIANILIKKNVRFSV